MTASVTGDTGIAGRISALVDAPITSIASVDKGAYSPARRWLVTFEDGSSAFAKLGTDCVSAEGIRVEHTVYVDLALACMPHLIAYDDDRGGDEPLMLIDDLSAESWAPPWPGVSVDDLLGALDEVHAARPPALLQRHASELGDRQEWVRIAADSREFLKAEVCTRDWLIAGLPTFAAAANAFETAGSSLLHGDLFLQNWCVTERGPAFVDWSGARVGNPDTDRVHLLHGVRVCGGPWTTGVETLVPANSVAWFAGRLAAWAAEGRDSKPASFLETQRRELWHGLCWAASVFDLAPPELPAGAAPIGDYRP